MQGDYLMAFSWPGGKLTHLDWLLPLLPTDCQSYVEPFCGAASVLLNRAPSPIEVLSDKDDEVVNFLRVLRDHREALLERLHLTPCARAEVALALELPIPTDPIERARRFYVLARQSHSGMGLKRTQGDSVWGYTVDMVRRGVAASISQWLSGIDGLTYVATRLLTVQIDCRPALEVIERFDTPSTFFYLDPPYVHSARLGRVYAQDDMTDKDHEVLAEMVHACKGRVAISGYRTNLYDRLYKDWYCYEMGTDSRILQGRAGNPERSPRIESLWCNYQARPSLFDALRAQDEKERKEAP
jgi:DNA adenine methylase